MRSATTNGKTGVGKAVTGCASAVGRSVTSCFSSFKGKSKSHEASTQRGWNSHAHEPFTDHGAAFGDGALRYNPFSDDVRSPRPNNAWKQSAASKPKQPAIPKAKAFGEGALERWH